MKTKSFRLLTVLMAAVMMVALSLNVLAAKSNAVTQDGITAQLVTDKDSYKAGESVKASVQVDNHTGREVFIFAQISVPEGVKLASENAAFDARLQDGDTWTTPGGVLTAGGASATGSSAATGDNMQAGLWVILTVLAVCGIVALFVYGKNKKTWLSIMLCMVMVAGMAVAAVPAQAADMNGDIMLSCAIQVDGKDTAITTTVSYVIYDEAEEAEIPVETTTPAETPEATIAPTVAPTEETTPTPTVAPTEEPTPTIAPTEEPASTPTPTAPPTTAPDAYENEGWVDILYGRGDFESETDKWWPIYDNKNTQIEYRTEGAPSGNTYLYLGDNDTTTGASRVWYDYNYDNYKIKAGATYKITGWVRQDGDSPLRISTGIGNGQWGHYDIPVSQRGVWERFEIEITIAEEKAPGSFNLRLSNMDETAGGVALDGLKYLEESSGDPIESLVQAWNKKLADEEAVSMMVEGKVSDNNPYVYKEPLPGATNLIPNGTFSTGATIIRKSGVDGTNNNSGWNSFITANTAESDLEITEDGTLKITYYDAPTRATGGVITTIEGITGGAEYQVSFRYRIDPRTDTNTSKRYGPFVDAMTYPDPSIPGAAGKMLEDIALTPYNSDTLIADGEWHTFYGRSFVSEQAWMMEVSIRAHLYPGNSVEIDDVECWMTDVRGEMDLNTDEKFYYSDLETGTFTASLLASLFPNLANGNSKVDFIVYDGQTQVWSATDVAFDTNNVATVNFPLSTMTKMGSPYVVKAILKDNSGNTVSEMTEDIFKYPRPTSLDADGNYIKFGDDFDYVSSCHYYVDEDMYKSRDDIDLTLRSLVNARDAEHALEQLDKVHAAGLKGWVTIYRDMLPSGHPEKVYTTIDVVSDERIRNHPALMGYSIMDEPWLYGIESDVQKWLEDSYRLIREYDTDNVIEICECTHQKYAETGKYCDTLTIDPYHEAAGAQVYTKTAKAVAAVNGRKPVWALLEAYKTGLGRILSADEVRNNNWQALIGGAHGIGYFSMSDGGGKYVDDAGVTHYIPMWEATTDVEPYTQNTGAKLWAGLMEWADKEQELAFDHFVHGKTPDFNEEVAIGDGYIYSSWKVDNDVYMVVLNVAGAEVANLNIPLTSAEGSESIAEYTAVIVAGRNEDTATITGNGSMTVTLQKDEAILYKITPGTSGDNTGSGDNTEGGDNTGSEEIDLLNGAGNFEAGQLSSDAWDVKSSKQTNIQFIKEDGTGNTYLYLGDLPKEGGTTQGQSRVEYKGEELRNLTTGAAYIITGKVRRDGDEIPEVSVVNVEGDADALQGFTNNVAVRGTYDTTNSLYTYTITCANTGEWEQFTIVFTVKNDAKKCAVTLQNMNRNSSGTGAICFDDIKVLPVSTASNE